MLLLFGFSLNFFKLKLKKKNVSFLCSKKFINMNLFSDFEEIFKKKVNSDSSSYRYDPSYPGTAPPGLIKENISLQEVMQLKINNLNVQEFSRDQQCGVIRGADESILEWLEFKGRIKPRLKEDLKEDLTEKNQTLLEDEFDFEDVEDSLENLFGHPSSNLSDFV
jgi:hypothetical protein